MQNIDLPQVEFFSSFPNQNLCSSCLPHMCCVLPPWRNHPHTILRRPRYLHSELNHFCIPESGMCRQSAVCKPLTHRMWQWRNTTLSSLYHAIAIIVLSIFLHTRQFIMRVTYHDTVLIYHFKVSWLLFSPPGLTFTILRSAHTVYVFCVDLRTNSDYFTVHH
jgi:hypothetical protein